MLFRSISQRVASIVGVEFTKRGVGLNRDHILDETAVFPMRGEQDLNVVARFRDGSYNRVCSLARCRAAGRDRQVDCVALLTLDVETTNQAS